MIALRAQRILTDGCISRRTVMSVLFSASKMRTNVNMDLQVVLTGNWYWVVTRFPCKVVVYVGISSGHLTICWKKFVLADGNVNRRQYKCSLFKRLRVDTSSCRLCTRDIRQNACKSKCNWNRNILCKVRPSANASTTATTCTTTAANPGSRGILLRQCPQQNLYNTFFLNRSSTVHFDKYEIFLVQQMHYLLKHKILQFVFKYLNVHFSAPYMFRSTWTIFREHTSERC
jgi:hypothetical protein